MLFLQDLWKQKEYADITISIDCDGQDDIDAMDKMVDAYLNGADIVYGVRSKRTTDTFFKRFTAESFYKLLNSMGVEVVFNHADYRLVSKRVLEAFSDFKEVNIFLRGMFPLVGFNSTSVYYERHERLAGESHYPLKKMLELAFDGITSLSIKTYKTYYQNGNCDFNIGCYCHYMGNRYGNTWWNSCRLGKYCLHSMYTRWNTAHISWGNRGIYWKNIYGDKEKTALHYQ